MVTAVLFLLITFTPGTVIVRRRVIKSVREVVTESSPEPSEEPGKFITAHQGSRGKVMFSPVSVWSHGGSPFDHSHDAMGLTVQAPLDIRPGTTWSHPQDIKPGFPLQPQPPLLVTSGGHHWRPVETC